MSEPFEWDPEKERANVAKHGITFAEAQSVFLDPLVYMAPDDRHSREEYRFTALGISQQHRLLFVVLCPSRRRHTHHRCTARHSPREEGV